MAVLQVVEVHLVPSLADVPGDRGDRMQVTEDDTCEELAQRPRLRVRELTPKRQQNVQSCLTRRLHVIGESDRLAYPMQQLRGADHIGERGFLRVEIDHTPVRKLQ